MARVVPADEQSRSRQQRLEELFHQLADLPAPDRQAAAALLCAENEALAQEALELLDSSESAEELIAAATPLHTGLSRSDEWIGKQIGPFLVDELVGLGGMGFVFRSHRAGDHVSGQTVALKISSQGIRSQAAIQQLLLERDTLARLQHPNIARLLDAGIIGADLPWMAMEFIDGRALDVVCDDPATSIDDRLRFAGQLCAALGFVHRNLVLHRDLKPSNVMVTPEGVVKLLDFGIAKWTGPSAPDSPLTEAGLRPLTLKYASPEHIRGEPLTTASDIYSLGVLLHRMFTGGLPDSGRTVQGSPQALTRDLQEIIGKCLRPEAEHRYGSVDELASDLENAREGRAVRAYQGTWRYRAGKFFRRHTAGVLASLGIVVALLTGLWLVARQSAIELVEEHRAQEGLLREETLAHALLFDFFEKLKAIPGSTDAQRRTVTEALKYLDRLRKSPAGVSSALEPDLIEAYTDFGNLLGSPYEENLGDAEGAKRALQEAISVAQARVAGDRNNLESMTELSRAEMSLARIYFGAGDPQTAIRYMQPAAAASDRIAADSHATSAQIAQAASTLDALGDVEFLPGSVCLNDPAKALAAIAKAQAYDEKGFALDPNCARCHRGIVTELWKRGVMLEDSDPAASAVSYRAGLAELARFPVAEQQASRLMRLATLLRAHLGTDELHLNHPQKAEEAILPAHAALRQAIARDPVDARARFDLAALDNDLGQAQLELHETTLAAASYSEELACSEFLLQHNPQNVPWQLLRLRSLVGLGRTGLLKQNRTGARQAAQQALRLIVSLTADKNASVETLDLAAQSLVQLTDLIPESRELALQTALRAIQSSPNPTAEQYATLNSARRLAHRTAL